MFYTHPHYLNWKLYYKLFFGLLITCTLIGFWIDGLVTGVSDFQYNGSFDRGDYTVNYFSYFTTLSNVFVAYWLFGTSLFFEKENNSKLFSYNVCLGITVYITITFLIYNIVLLPTSMPNTPKAWTSSAIEHMVTPIATVCYFLFIMKKTVVVNSKTITRKTTWRFLIFPIAWCIISLIRGEFRYDAGKNNPYQYFFLNLHDPKFGIPGFVWFIIAFIVVFSMIYGFTSLYNYYRFRYQNLFSSNHKLIH